MQGFVDNDKWYTFQREQHKPADSHTEESSLFVDFAVLPYRRIFVSAKHITKWWIVPEVNHKRCPNEVTGMGKDVTRYN